MGFGVSIRGAMLVTVAFAPRVTIRVLRVRGFRFRE